MPKRYHEEFRRKVVDLVASGRPVAQAAADLGITDQTIYGWRRQELIDTGHRSDYPKSFGRQRKKARLGTPRVEWVRWMSRRASRQPSWVRRSKSSRSAETTLTVGWSAWLRTAST